jgi:hypothetical protein
VGRRGLAAAQGLDKIVVVEGAGAPLRAGQYAHVNYAGYVAGLSPAGACNDTRGACGQFQ